MGDNGRVVLLQLVGEEESAQKKTKTSARKQAPEETEEVVEVAGPQDQAANEQPDETEKKEGKTKKQQ